ncbi:MAG: tryptophan 7-halogenase [Planctomycetaceae bacterium]|nr:tryptophan 7-halogenase [Planctomycetaceae bacterium]MCB9953817.1 tryptophan 7-halogenase [Planctomycetaceae bacterium]
MIQAAFSETGEYSGEINDQYDVVVIGGGPAGATVSTILAEYGHDVLVLERSTIPRFHVGESLIPETYWVLDRLGLVPQLKASAYPKKFSVQFVSDGWKESAPFYFDMMNPHESSQTWQVERADFDKMLIDNAVAKGVTVRTQAQVLEVTFEGDRATGVRVKLGASSRNVAAKVVVDCSGNSAFLCNRLGLRVGDPLLQKGTVWSYFKGALRDEGRDEGATIILQTEDKKSWFWYIPLRDDVVSIGCTGNMQYMFPKGSSPEATFERELERCPALQKRLENATRCMDFFTTRDYSYRSKQAAGDGWVLCGDAFSFVDPVYSSGVFLALKCGEIVADNTHAALVEGDTSGERLGIWRDDYAKGVENFRKLVYAFYTPGFSFGDFMREHPGYKDHLVDILIGAVFKPGVSDIFEAMGDIRPPSDRVEPEPTTA